jgi:hypothetical protein
VTESAVEVVASQANMTGRVPIAAAPCGVERVEIVAGFVVAKR